MNMPNMEIPTLLDLRISSLCDLLQWWYSHLESFSNHLELEESEIVDLQR